jgi:hypothetical protein
VSRSAKLSCLDGSSFLFLLAVADMVMMYNV